MSNGHYETMELDTIFYTGWGVPATSCWLEVRLLDFEDLNPYPADAQIHPYLCTTRNGHVCQEALNNITRIEELASDAPTWRQRFRVPIGLSNDFEGLTARLMNLWEFSNERQPGTRGRTHEPSTLHYFNERRAGPERPTGSAVPRLMTDIPYLMKVDWAFPYCLLAENAEGGVDERTRLYPFDLSGCRSQILGQQVRRQGSWNRQLIVMFNRIPGSREYSTQVWNPRTGQWNDSIFPPEFRRRGADRETDWMLRRDGTPKPRAVLPHKDGFLLLQKLFLKTFAAYKLLLSYDLTQQCLQKDLCCLGELDHMLELLGCSTPVGDVDLRRAITEAFGVITDWSALTNDAARRALELLANNCREPFEYLLNFWNDQPSDGRHVNASFNHHWETDWFQFSHYLGPLTFMTIALWILRRSPFHAAAFNRYGPLLLEVPSGVWEGPTNEENDPMLVDSRIRDQRAIGAVRHGMMWSKCSAKVMANLAQMYMSHLALGLYPVIEAASWNRAVRVWGLVDRVDRMVRALDLADQLDLSPSPPIRFLYEPRPGDIQRWVEYLARADSAQVEQFIGELVPRDQPAQLARPARPDAAVFQELQFAQRLQLPAIASAVDCLYRVTKLIQLGYALENSARDSSRRWQRRDILDVVDVGRQLLGLSTSGAALFGTGARTLLAKACIAAAAVDCFLYSTRTIEAFAHREEEASYRLIQTAGALITLTGCILVLVPGAGVPLGFACGALGAILDIAGGQGLASVESRTTRWETHASELVATLYQVSPFHRWSGQLGRGVTAGPFRQLLQQYNSGTAPTKRATRITLSGISPWTLRQFAEGSGTWNLFPGTRWLFLERGEGVQRAEYIRYCQSLDPAWQIPHAHAEVAPPPPFRNSCPERPGRDLELPSMARPV